MRNIEEREKLSSFLSKIGLSSNEIRIYLALNKYGDMNVADINRTSSVPRTSIVRNIKRLVQKGLVSTTVKNSQKLYIAETPDKLESIVRAQEIEIKARLNEISEVKE